ncbi:LacI family DNA-binding transcriptional regulator [Roseibium porphyridii]|uniref:LacI family DNA-binding transcriptional regulator n=1 Tax=Roseibium porphyridii TaxID=2866279 RepID=A0ABY8F502_9HYPH|nr:MULTISPECIES: LacI family DNA-binding transcriptional regulator [Stappiaceae]QFT29784.1 Ribose operon repressor [Labrenzia sp. THAF82]WFE90509.1 LacI family DNA-binding transcriptional regulator [Roseibium sp. KMA01]
MPTIKDVARKAGVSVGTVSRVLAKNETVKHPLKLKVQAAMKELDYKPNLAARALRTNSIDVIGLVVPDITNPFFAQLAKNIEMEAAKRSHSVMVANSHDDADTEKTQIAALLDRAVCGVIVVATADGRSLDATDVPIVSLDRRFGEFPLIATDHFDGSQKIADHLHALGHRRIAYIAGPLSMDVARSRREGFVSRIKALSSAEDPIELTIFEGQFDYDSGEELGREILNQAGVNDRPTAIAAASDQQAIGVLRCARDLKLDVPADLSVAGFDDITLASLVVPRLTTLRQPIEALAVSAVEQIFQSKASLKDMAIAGDIVERESTGPNPVGT